MFAAGTSIEVSLFVFSSRLLDRSFSLGGSSSTLLLSRSTIASTSSIF